jgi:hypothetical protein
MIELLNLYSIFKIMMANDQHMSNKCMQAMYAISRQTEHLWENPLYALSLSLHPTFRTVVWKVQVGEDDNQKFGFLIQNLLLIAKNWKVVTNSKQAISFRESYVLFIKRSSVYAEYKLQPKTLPYDFWKGTRDSNEFLRTFAIKVTMK